MSLEQNFNQKLSISGGAEEHSSVGDNHHLSLSPATSNNPQQNTNLPSPASPASGGSSSGGGFNFKSLRNRSKSPSGRDHPGQGQGQGSSDEANHFGPSSPGPGGPGGHLTRGQSAPLQVSGLKDKDKAKVTKKIFNNWRSACGKTKDKTKDLIRRWKTLPENCQEFENFKDSSAAGSSGGGSDHGGGQSNGHGHGGSKNKRKNLTKKTSEVDIPNGGLLEDPGCGVGASFSLQQKSTAGWSVHVWATYVQRGLEDEVTNEEVPPARDFLSEFQKVKLIHFLHHVLDMNRDGVLERDDFVALNQRIRHYVEWSSECIEYHILKEVHSGFLECFLNQPLDESSSLYYCSRFKETRHHVTYDDWLDVWGEMLQGAKSLQHLPLWLQYFPKILFQVINKSGSGLISKEELRAFYTMFLGIDFRVVNETLDSIYAAMTDDGSTKITYGLFKLCFTNFLLGKYPHGPGQYLFGICSPQSLVCAFPIDYSALNTPADDLEPYDPDNKSQSNRRSVII